MKTAWFRKFRLIKQITSQIKTIRDTLSATILDEPYSSPEGNSHEFFQHIFNLLDTLQQFFSPNGKPPDVVDYDDRSPNEVNLTPAQLIVVFRRTIEQLQHTSPTVQHAAQEILHFYFIELQGLYDLVSVRRVVSARAELPFSLAALEEYHKQYFRCFKVTDQACVKLQKEGVPEEIVHKLAPLKNQGVMTEEGFFRKLVSCIGDKRLADQYQFPIFKHTQVLQHLTSDPLIREYKSIPYDDLMHVSILHHLRALLKLYPLFIVKTIADVVQRQPRCRRIQSADVIETCDQLRAFLSQHPLSPSVKIQVALHRHLMRIFELAGARLILHWGKPMFELIILSTWLQTVKDHILPGHDNPNWQAAYLNLAENKEQLVADIEGDTGKIRMSSALFMQPRVKFGLERFLIFKLRTMTVTISERVPPRPTELGNWMRLSSTDEFFQFFNIALGDIGGLGIRTMPEHEIVETDDTLWLYSALMSFVPGGVTSPGSIVMRNKDYRLSKADQLMHEIRYYDPRFKGSSGLLMDIKKVLGSLSVLNKGRVGMTLLSTESFGDKKRGY